VAAQDFEAPAVLPLRDRAAAQIGCCAPRLDQVVPQIMRRHGVDMWIVAGREYAEDPVLRSMLPGIWQSARRTMLLISMIAAKGAGWSGSPPPGTASATVRARVGPGGAERSMGARRELVRERDPKRIAVNL
jgi:hypothetical protein